MKVGFTGTKKGMTIEQKETLLRCLMDLGCVEFHHGDCVGADEEAHDIANGLGIHIVIHPPNDDRLRAFKIGGEILPAKDYLKRNKNIVNSTEFLIGCPEDSTPVLRSGTWSTIRYSHKCKDKKHIVISRNGFTFKMEI